ncbi:MAG: DUF2306 domain-containing protein [Gammaproteobacteria bacterium]|nr:DUF2306 domain-containing protein [Gammaproteobacteria bacterium]
MSLITTDKIDNSLAGTTKNWPLVGSLFALTAIPGIPAILIIVLILTGPIDSALLMSLINPSYFESPLAVLVHGSSGIAFFLTMPLQFSPAFRQNHPQWHRIAGRVVLLSAYAMAASGIWMHQVLTPDELGMRYVGLILISLGICVAFTLAFYFVIKGQIAAHRRWMYRSVAVSLAVVTPLFIEIVAVLTIGQVEAFKPFLVQFLHDYDRLIALCINLLIAELLLRKK